MDEPKHLPHWKNSRKSLLTRFCRCAISRGEPFVPEGKNAMKRLLILSLVAAGCVGFEDYVQEDLRQEQVAPASCGCQVPTTPAISAVSGRLPAVSQLPAIQTREPDLLQPK
jgi:hypothetical protein